MSYGRTLRRYVKEHGRETAVRLADEAFKSGKLTSRDVSLRGMAEGMLGPDWEMHLGQYAANPAAYIAASRGTESADAVDATAFIAITGNQIITTIKEKYAAPEFIGDQLVDVIHTPTNPFDQQRVPWLGNVGSSSGYATNSNDDEDLVQQGMPFERTDFSSNYYTLLRPQKRTRGLDVTMEMIAADRTGQAYSSAESVARRLGIGRERRILRVVLGLVNNFTYSYSGGAEVTTNTYVQSVAGSNSAGTRWVNALNSNPLTSWAALNKVERTFSEMRDPNTGEPIEVNADTILVMPGNVLNAQQILHATGVRRGPGGSTSTSAPVDTVTYAANNLKAYNLLSSKWAFKIASGATWPKQDYFDDSNTANATDDQTTELFYVGDFKRAFYYREFYPLRVVQAPPMNPLEFEKDVVLSVKASEFGVAGVKDPRYVVRSWGHSFDTETD